MRFNIKAKGIEKMDELRGFVKGLIEMDFSIVSICEVCGDVEIVNVKVLLNRMRDIVVSEIVAEYYESFEFVTSDGKYIEINRVC